MAKSDDDHRERRVFAPRGGHGILRQIFEEHAHDAIVR